jgi:long-subunit fatty acid transport protein
MIARRRLRLDRLAIVVGACATVPAVASPRSDPTDGRAVFTGATSHDPTSIDLNPGAIAEGSFDYELYAAVTGTFDHYGITPRALDLATGAEKPLAHLSDNELAPGATVAAVFHLGGGFALGVDLLTPPREQFVGQPSLGYSTLGGGQRDLYGLLATSYKASDDIYFGVSIGFVRNQLRYHYLRDTALANGTGQGGIGSSCGASTCGIGNAAAAQRFDLDVATPFTAGELAINLGGLVQVAHDVWIGAAFHAPPGTATQSDLTGTATVTQAPRDGGAVIHGDAVVSYSQPAAADVELRARLVDDLDLHVGGRWQDLSRLATYDVRVYGAAPAAAGVPEWNERARGLHDPFAFWAGVEQADHPEDRWRFGARVGYETSSVDADRTSALTIAGDQYTLDLGVQLRLTRSVLLQLSYGLAYFPTVSVTKSAFDPRSMIDCINSGYDYVTAGCADVRNGYAGPTADGDYSRIQQAMRFGFRYDAL